MSVQGASATRSRLEGTRRSGRRFWRALIHSRTAILGWLMLLPIVFASIFAGSLTPFEPTEQNMLGRLQPPGSQVDDRTHLLGSDSLGRDVFTRILHGGRVSLMVGVLAILISGGIGVTLGLLAGHFGGRLDSLIMRLADVQLAIPTLILALTVIAIFGAGIRNVILVLGITGWVAYARIVRGEVLSVRENEYMLAAKALGAGQVRQMIAHVLPNVTASIIVVSTLRLGTVVILEASLSFLGLGIQPPTATWGNMIAGGRDLLYSAWWVSTFPGIALSLTVIAVNVIGDWFRDVLDPRLQDT